MHSLRTCHRSILFALALGLGFEPALHAQAAAGTPEALKKALEADGFIVQDGKFKVIPLFQMYDAHLVPSCFANNASSPYLLPMVPLGPGQSLQNLPPNPMTDYPLVPEDKGLYYEYSLRPGEAIVMVGKTPPTVEYFGYRSYLVRRYLASDAAYEYILASLGDQANNLTTATSGTPFGKIGTDPYAKAVMFISTADAETDRRVRTAAASAGYAPDIINTDVMPSSLVRLGTATPDSFLLLHRVALFADSNAEKAYLQNPGMTVFRITPKQQAANEPLAVPELRIKGTGNASELDLLPTEEELGQAILAKYSYLKPRDLQPSVAFEAGYDAIQRGTDALGDNRDTIYLRSTNFLLRDRPDDFVVVYGANHMATGKATYSNFTVYGRIALNGVAAVNSTNFGTAAEEFLPGDPLAKYFYVYKIARHCERGDSLPCIEVPTGPGAAGIPFTHPALIGFRAYLESSTKVGPTFEEVLYDRAIKFNPR